MNWCMLHFVDLMQVTQKEDSAVMAFFDLPGLYCFRLIHKLLTSP